MGMNLYGDKGIFDKKRNSFKNMLRYTANKQFESVDCVNKQQENKNDCKTECLLY